MHTSHDSRWIHLYLARSSDHFSMALTCVQFRFQSTQDLFPDNDPSHAQESQVRSSFFVKVIEAKWDSFRCLSRHPFGFGFGPRPRAPVETLGVFTEASALSFAECVVGLGSSESKWGKFAEMNLYDTAERQIFIYNILIYIYIFL